MYIEAKAILAMTIHAYEFEKVQDGGYDRLYSVS